MYSSFHLNYIHIFSDTEEIHRFYNKLAKKKSKLVKIETIGSSIEDRDIIVVKINDIAELPAIVIDAGMKLSLKSC